MKAQHPFFDLRLKYGAAVWQGGLTPTALSDTYRVRIGYRSGTSPEVSVIEPRLRRRDETEPIPHTYIGDYLCLYRPKYREWLPTLFIADTIVPWTSLWLYYYEVWHATGEWLGGGEHPVERRREKGR